MTNNSKAAPMVMGIMGSASSTADVPNGAAAGIDGAGAAAAAVGVRAGVGVVAGAEVGVPVAATTA